MSSKVRIAIDGPSGAGKSTIAKSVAAALDVDYIDTGAMYRAVAYKAIKETIDLTHEAEMAELLKTTDIDFSGGNLILDGETIHDQIRTPQVTKMASACSALPAVRKKLVELQRKMGREKSVIMDGRDIGTNVLLDAEYKFFMTASAEERARRRHLELSLKGQPGTYEQVLEDMIQRDYRDTTRELNPLCRAEDAVEIDTTGMSIEDVTNYILQEVTGHGDCQTI